MLFNPFSFWIVKFNKIFPFLSRGMFTLIFILIFFGFFYFTFLLLILTIKAFPVLILLTSLFFSSLLLAVLITLPFEHWQWYQLFYPKFLLVYLNFLIICRLISYEDILTIYYDLEEENLTYIFNKLYLKLLKKEILLKLAFNEDLKDTIINKLI
jgi:hypothetical protein